MVRWGAVVLVAVMLSVAGCSGPGDRTPEPLEGTASPATLGESARSSAGYDPATVEQDRVNRSGTLDVSGDVGMTVGYRIRATAQRAVYRSSAGDPPSVLALYSAPLVSPDAVAVTLDPLGDRSTTAIVERVQDTYGSLGQLEHLGNSTVTVLGNETTLARYATSAEVDGTALDVVVYVAVVRHGGDVVRAVAVFPRERDDPETVRQLLAALDH